MPRLTTIVLAAGQGTRMKSKTPKVLHELCGLPMVAWPIEAARAAGSDRVVVVQGPDRALEGRVPEGVELAVQPEPRGTGDAVRAAAPFIDRDDTVVVLMGDAPLVTPEVVAALAAIEAGADAAAATMVLEDPSGYGRVLRGADGSIARVVETKVAGDATPEELAIREVNAGMYAFAGGPLLDALERLRPDNAQGEYYLPDVLPLVGRSVAVPVPPEASLGVNDRVDLAAVRAIAQARILARLAREDGVTVVDPGSTHVDVTVTIGQDTRLEPFTSLRGTTRIGADCVIGPHVHAVDAELHDGVSVGPFAYLRPGAVLRDRSKAGTFVEIKNSDIGEGTKVPHLSYLGDATVGPGANIGAANVTANYDGRAKHRTTIGAGVRTGVDTTFVAPVTVGDGAYTAAGSVITEDVPAEALGVARARQRVVAGYARRKG
jgi:bifunctional UDP-N-acetylglucosamine pyrophosphorylase/glucosamine-1-phosphate N-acetyltransferase